MEANTPPVMSTYFDGLPLGYFGAGIIDPGWQFATWSAKGRGKSRQYTCQSLDEICALPVGELFLDDAAIALWSTQIANAKGWHADALRAWGFEPQSSGSWKKVTKNGKPFFGTGFILRSCAEFFTIGTRGRPRPQSRSIRNFIEARWRAFESLLACVNRADTFATAGSGVNGRSIPWCAAVIAAVACCIVAGRKPCSMPSVAGFTVNLNPQGGPSS
jgi:hypothetical protein